MDNFTSRMDKAIDKVLINKEFFNTLPTAIAHTLSTDAFIEV